MLTMSDEEFEVLVEEGIAAIPEEFAHKVDNVAVVIEPAPTREQITKMKLRPGWTLFGLYEGIPLTKRGETYTFVAPDKITIFRIPILEAARDLLEAREMLKDTVWHEFAHYFGMDEYEVRQREEGRGKSHS